MKRCRAPLLARHHRGGGVSLGARPPLPPPFDSGISSGRGGGRIRFENKQHDDDDDIDDDVFTTAPYSNGTAYHHTRNGRNATTAAAAGSHHNQEARRGRYHGEEEAAAAADGSMHNMSKGGMEGGLFFRDIVPPLSSRSADTSSSVKATLNANGATLSTTNSQKASVEPIHISDPFRDDVDQHNEVKSSTEKSSSSLGSSRSRRKKVTMTIREGLTAAVQAESLARQTTFRQLRDDLIPALTSPGSTRITLEDDEEGGCPRFMLEINVSRPSPVVDSNSSAAIVDVNDWDIRCRVVTNSAAVIEGLCRVIHPDHWNLLIDEGRRLVTESPEEANGMAVNHVNSNKGAPVVRTTVYVFDPQEEEEVHTSTRSQTSRLFRRFLTLCRHNLFLQHQCAALHTHHRDLRLLEAVRRGAVPTAALEAALQDAGDDGDAQRRAFDSFVTTILSEGTATTTTRDYSTPSRSDLAAFLAGQNAQLLQSLQPNTSIRGGGGSSSGRKWMETTDDFEGYAYDEEVSNPRRRFGHASYAVGQIASLNRVDRADVGYMGLRRSVEAGSGFKGAAAGPNVPQSTGGGSGSTSASVRFSSMVAGIESALLRRSGGWSASIAAGLKDLEGEPLFGLRHHDNDHKWTASPSAVDQGVSADIGVNSQEANTLSSSTFEHKKTARRRAKDEDDDDDDLSLEAQELTGGPFSWDRFTRAAALGSSGGGRGGGNGGLGLAQQLQQQRPTAPDGTALDRALQLATSAHQRSFSSPSSSPLLSFGAPGNRFFASLPLADGGIVTSATNAHALGNEIVARKIRGRSTASLGASVLNSIANSNASASSGSTTAYAHGNDIDDSYLAGGQRAFPVGSQGFRDTMKRDASSTHHRDGPSKRHGGRGGDELLLAGNDPLVACGGGAAPFTILSAQRDECIIFAPPLSSSLPSESSSAVLLREVLAMMEVVVTGGATISGASPSSATSSFSSTSTSAATSTSTALWCEGDVLAIMALDNQNAGSAPATSSPVASPTVSDSTATGNGSRVSYAGVALVGPAGSGRTTLALHCLTAGVDGDVSASVGVAAAASSSVKLVALGGGFFAIPPSDMMSADAAQVDASTKTMPPSIRVASLPFASGAFASHTATAVMGCTRRGSGASSSAAAAAPTMNLPLGAGTLLGTLAPNPLLDPVLLPHTTGVAAFLREAAASSTATLPSTATAGEGRDRAVVDGSQAQGVAAAECTTNTSPQESAMPQDVAEDDVIDAMMMMMAPPQEEPINATHHSVRGIATGGCTREGKHHHNPRRPSRTRVSPSPQYEGICQYLQSLSAGFRPPPTAPGPFSGCGTRSFVWPTKSFAALQDYLGQAEVVSRENAATAAHNTDAVLARMSAGYLFMQHPGPYFDYYTTTPAPAAAPVNNTRTARSGAAAGSPTSTNSTSASRLRGVGSGASWPRVDINELYAMYRWRLQRQRRRSQRPIPESKEEDNSRIMGEGRPACFHVSPFLGQSVPLRAVIVLHWDLQENARIDRQLLSKGGRQRLMPPPADRYPITIRRVTAPEAVKALLGNALVHAQAEEGEGAEGMETVNPFSMSAPPLQSRDDVAAQNTHQQEERAHAALAFQVDASLQWRSTSACGSTIGASATIPSSSSSMSSLSSRGACPPTPTTLDGLSYAVGLARRHILIPTPIAIESVIDAADGEGGTESESSANRIVSSLPDVIATTMVAQQQSGSPRQYLDEAPVQASSTAATSAAPVLVFEVTGPVNHAALTDFVVNHLKTLL